MKIIGKFFILLIVYTACKEDKQFIPREHPLVETLAVSDITSDGLITLNGTMIDFGNSEVIDHGFVWDTKQTLTLQSPNKRSLGVIGTLGTFNLVVRSGIMTTKKYYIRAFARNQTKVVFGELIEFEPIRQSPKHLITDFNPKSGIWGDEITISGANFDANNLSNNSVNFGSSSANIIEVSDSTINVEVPSDLIQIETKIEVIVSSSSILLSDPFKLNGPEAISFSPSEVSVGDTVTLSGKNFHPLIINNIVTIGGKTSMVFSASSESLEVGVPVLNPGEYDINLSVFGESETFSPKITILGPEPGTFAPTSGISGSEVLLSGNNFGNTISLVEVFFNSTPAQVMEVSNSLIRAEVPALLSGDYSITVAISGSQVQFPGGFTVITPPPPTTGLVAYYPLNGDANDLSGNGFNGVINGATLNTNRNGKNNTALDFDGFSSNVDLGDILDDVFTGPDKQFSISLWIRPSISMSNNLIISKLGASGCGEDQREFTIRVLDDKINLLFYNSLLAGSFRRIQSSTSLTINNWHHIVLNYNGSLDSNNGLDRITIYVNNTQESLSLTGSEGGLGSLQDGTAHLGLGNPLDSNGDICGNDLAFNGGVDDVRIYSRILNVAEIDALFNE